MLCEAAVESLVFCFIFDDAGHRVFACSRKLARHGSTGDIVEGDSLQEVLGIFESPDGDLATTSSRSSHALWSSIYTPQELRELLFEVSAELMELNSGENDEQQTLLRSDGADGDVSG